MKLILRFFLAMIFYGIAPVGAFMAAYSGTERYFREKLVPYPFELYGMAIGAGFLFWVLALGTAAMGLLRKRRVF